MPGPASMRWTELAIAGAIVLAAVRPAAAEDKVKQADALFAEGVKLRDSNLELACAKFGESLQLNPQAIGVLLNVAMCDEKHGRVASAVRRYRETRERAIEQSFPEYQKAADAKLEVLTPEVPYLTIRFDRPPAAQTKIVVDEQVVSPSALEKLPLDPGERVVVVSAPGRISFQRRISLAKGERREVAVPPLEKPSSRRTIGKIVFATGGAAVATSVVLGFLAKRNFDEAANTQDSTGEAVCTPVEMSDDLVCSNSTVFADLQSARQLGDIGTIVGAAGLATMLAGGYLWFFAPKPYAAERRRVSVVPRVAPGGGGIAVFGRF